MEHSSRSKGKDQKGKRKGSPPRVYSWITLDEVRARESKYLTRLSDIKIAKKFIRAATNQVNEIVGHRVELKRWQDYADCVNLPEPHVPPDLRTFFEKVKVFKAEDVEKTINWLLAIDERSILTQNIFVKDRTRRTLLTEIVPDIGGRYDHDINLGLRVLKSMDYFFDDPTLTIQCPKHILEDLQIVKKIAQDEIALLFDGFTYRIISCDDAYMTDVDPWTAEYIYESPNGNFEINIWTLKHIAIRFQHLENAFWDADMHGINLKVRLPLGYLEDDLTLRGLHFNFDHLSENAISFNPVVDVPIENLNAGIPDLYECLINEWLMQLKIQEEVRNHLIEKRLDFEEKKKEQEEEEARRAKERKGKDGGAKKKDKNPKSDKAKSSKEPPIVEPGKFPDVWSDFLEREQMEYDNFMNTVYHPDTLKLLPHEINLKQYFILGGIYQLNFVDKPRHYCIRTFNMTWHFNNGNLNVRKHANAPDSRLQEDDSFLDPFGTSRKRQSTRKSQLENLDIETRYAKLFRLTFKLPEHLCLWSDPVVCQYEDDAIGYIEEEVKPSTSLIPMSKAAAKAAAAAARAAAAAEQKAAEKKVRDPAIFEGSIVPTTVGRRSTGSVVNIYRPLMSFQQIFRRSTSARSISKFYDFYLDLPIAKPDLRNLERHCVPRILSSYRFQKEIEEAIAAKGKDKSKGKGGMLVRQRSSVSEEEVASVDPQAQQALQDSPERMYPKFSETEPLLIPEETKGTNITRPETFAELIETLDDIKKQYMQRPNVLLQIPDSAALRKFTTRLRLADANRPAIMLNRIRLRPAPESRPRGSIISRKKDKFDKSSGRLSIKYFDKSSMHSEQILKRQTIDIDRIATWEGGDQLNDDDQRQTRVRIRRRDEYAEEDDEDEDFEMEEVDKRQSYTYTHWTTKYIEHTEFNRNKRELIVYAQRLGTFGLAYNRYQHFPFRRWVLEPTNDNEINFTVETTHITAVLTITPDGVKGYVTDTLDTFVANPKKHLDIQEPINDYKELKKRFREKNVNIFADLDASFYIKGYFSQKHLATEMHVYSCMAVHCSSCKFMRSDWNRLAKRREILLSFRGIRDLEENTVTVRVAPEEATFVEVRELCSDNLDVIKLEFAKTWRNINPYHDLHNLIMSMFPGAAETRIRDPMLLTTIKNILSEVRPLSYS